MNKKVFGIIITIVATIVTAIYFYFPKRVGADIYVNKTLGFSIKYSDKWNTEERKYGGVDFVKKGNYDPNVYNFNLVFSIFPDKNVTGYGFKNLYEVNQYFSRINQDAGNKKVGLKFLIEKYTLMGQQGYLVSRSDAPDHKEIFLFYNGKPLVFEIYEYSNSEVQTALSTFKFDDADKTVLCTQEAKRCPDGSYVGRTGPKCEFALCP